MPLILRSSILVPLTFDEVDANFSYLEGLSTALSAQVEAFEAYSALTSVSNAVAVDLSLSDNFHHELTEDTTLSAPSNIVVGQKGIVQFTQNSGTPNTLAFDTFWKFPAGIPPTLTITASAVDVLKYTVDYSGTFAICEWLANIS